jgi:hypothetical protein
VKRDEARVDSCVGGAPHEFAWAHLFIWSGKELYLCKRCGRTVKA